MSIAAAGDGGSKRTSIVNRGARKGLGQNNKDNKRNGQSKQYFKKRL